MQIGVPLTRSMCRFSDTQFTDKACGPLLFILKLLFYLAFVSRNNDCKWAFETHILFTFDNPVVFSRTSKLLHLFPFMSPEQFKYNVLGDFVRAEHGPCRVLKINKVYWCLPSYFDFTFSLNKKTRITIWILHVRLIKQITDVYSNYMLKKVFRYRKMVCVEK